LSTRHSAFRGRLLLAFATVYLFWGSSFLATRIGVQQLPPLLFGATRFLIAGSIMLLIARYRGDRLLPARSEWHGLAVPALFGFIIANGTGVWSMQTVASNQAALLNMSAPCFIMLLGAFGARGHRPTLRGMIGLLLGFSGTLLLLQPAASGVRGTLGPQLVIIGGCLAWAISSIYMRNLGPVLSVLPLIGWQMLLGGSGLLTLGLLAGEASRWHWSWPGIGALLYLVVFASCFAHTAYAWLAPRTTPTSLSTYAYVNPVIATVLGWLILDEHLVPIQMLGMAVALCGVAMITWPGRMRQRQPRP
jgi:drug/metabolite transporter (DMT)-like permease